MKDYVYDEHYGGKQIKVKKPNQNINHKLSFTNHKTEIRNQKSYVTNHMLQIIYHKSQIVNHVLSNYQITNRKSCIIKLSNHKS
jgi:hypothetical protein